MKLSEMRELLARNGIRLTKSLGQNFLHDSHQLRRIVDAAELGPNDKVLEIGPGLGVLTELLLQKAGEVLAIEKDARLVEVLRGSRVEGRGERATLQADLTLLHADALEYIRRERRDWREWKMVSNLPYSVASPILVELAQAERGPERMVVTLQLEVARRLMAGPGSADYGLLTLLVQLNYEPEEFFKIPASCFFPEPEVDSSCVCLVRRREALLDAAHREGFVKVVKRSFSQRRKMMMKLLKVDWPAEKLARVFEQLKIPAQARGESISLEQFVRLTQALINK